MKVKETQKRTIFKTVSWRILAVINSWAVLSFFINESNFYKAIFMNITGFILFFVFERIWANFSYGRNIEQGE